jgi:hypothetical protein
MTDMMTLILALVLQDDAVTVQLTNSKTKTIRTTKAVKASEIPDLDDSTSLEFAYYFVAKDKIDAAELEKSLKGISGFKSVTIQGDRFYPVFEGEKLPSVAVVKKFVPVTEVAFAPARDGVRYVCEEDPEHVSASAGECCGSKRKKQPASKLVEKKGG